MKDTNAWDADAAAQKFLKEVPLSVKVAVLLLAEIALDVFLWQHFHVGDIVLAFLRRTWPLLVAIGTAALLLVLGLTALVFGKKLVGWWRWRTMPVIGRDLGTKHDEDAKTKRTLISRLHPKLIRIGPVDLRHNAHVMGSIGSGKTELLLNLFLGFCLRTKFAIAGVYFDPKDGLAIQKLLEHIPDSEAQRVVLIRPWDRQYAVGINVLEVGEGDNPDLIAEEAQAIFGRVLGADWGPKMKDAFRNGVLTLMGHTARTGEPTTICDLPALFYDPEARAYWLNGLPDGELKDYWLRFGTQQGGGPGKEIESIMARLRSMLTRDEIKAIFGQPRSTIDLEDLLMHGAMVLVDIPKGRIGDESSALIGSFMVSMLWRIAQRRAALPEKQRASVAVVLDEFQNFVGDAREIATILAEGRAYRIGWILAHQYLGQLQFAVNAAVEANTLTKVRLLGQDKRHRFHGLVKRREERKAKDWPEHDVVTYPLKGALGAEHAEQIAAASLCEHGTDRAAVMAALEARRRNGPGPNQGGPNDSDDDPPRPRELR